MSKEEKLASLKAKIAQAEEEENEVYLKYIVEVQNLTINMAPNSYIFINSGSPPPPPPYGGGG